MKSIYLLSLLAGMVVAVHAEEPAKKGRDGEERPHGRLQWWPREEARPAEKAIALAEKLAIEKADAEGLELSLAQRLVLIRAYLVDKDSNRVRKQWDRISSHPSFKRSPLASDPKVLFLPMVTYADDAQWTDYCAFLERFLSTRGSKKLLASLTATASPGTKPRLAALHQSIVRKSLEEVPGPDLKRVILHTRIAQILEDTDTLQLLAAWFREGADARPAVGKADLRQPAEYLQRQLDLATGNPEGIWPVLCARRDDDANWTVRWTLAGLPDLQRHGGRGNHYCSAVDAGAFDGQFDLRILAGADSKRLRIVAEVPQALGCGSVQVAMPAKASMFGLLAIRRDDGAILWAKPLNHSTVALPPLVAAQPAIRPTYVPPAPFGDDSAMIGTTVKPGEEIELFAFPWAPGRAIRFSTWLLVEGDGQLQLLFRDDKGRPLGATRWSASYPKIASHWERVIGLASHYSQFPEVATAHLVAVHRHKDGDHMPATIWISDPRFAVDPPAAIPVGIERIVRIPGTLRCLSVSLDETRLAAGHQDGSVHVLELARGEVSLSAKVGENALKWVGFAEDRVIALDHDQQLSAIDLASGEVTRLGTIETHKKSFPAITPDGKWIAWAEPRVDACLAPLGADKLGEAVTIPVGKDAHVWAHPRDAVFVVSGGADPHPVLIPFTDLPDLDPAALKPDPRSFTPKTPWPADGTPASNWTDPVHRLTIDIGESRTSLPAGSRTLKLKRDVCRTISANGIIFSADKFGFIHRIDPAKMEHYRGP